MASSSFGYELASACMLSLQKPSYCYQSGGLVLHSYVQLAPSPLTTRCHINHLLASGSRG
jgi:hypothetical protein